MASPGWPHTMVAVLTPTDPAIQPRRLKLDHDIVLVGRASKTETRGATACTDNALFDCPVISREHAEFELDEKSQVTITDLGSMHGTFVNGKMLKAHTPFELHEGDSIKFGTVVARGRGETYQGVSVIFGTVDSSIPQAGTTTGTSVYMVPPTTDEEESDYGSEADSVYEPKPVSSSYTTPESKKDLDSQRDSTTTERHLNDDPGHTQETHNSDQEKFRLRLQKYETLQKFRTRCMEHWAHQKIDQQDDLNNDLANEFDEIEEKLAMLEDKQSKLTTAGQSSSCADEPWALGDHDLEYNNSHADDAHDDNDIVYDDDDQDFDQDNGLVAGSHSVSSWLPVDLSKDTVAQEASTIATEQLAIPDATTKLRTRYDPVRGFRHVSPIRSPAADEDQTSSTRFPPLSLPPRPSLGSRQPTPGPDVAYSGWPPALPLTQMIGCASACPDPRESYPLGPIDRPIWESSMTARPSVGCGNLLRDFVLNQASTNVEGSSVGQMAISHLLADKQQSDQKEKARPYVIATADKQDNPTAPSMKRNASDAFAQDTAVKKLVSMKNTSAWEPQATSQEAGEMLEQRPKKKVKVRHGSKKSSFISDIGKYSLGAAIGMTGTFTLLASPLGGMLADWASKL